MRYRILLFLLLLLPAWAAMAQAPNWQTVLGNSATVVRGSAVNANGDYYVIGTYNGTLSLGGSAAALTSAGGTEDMFLAKFSSSTNTFVWAVSGGGSTGTEDGRAVAVNGSTIYVTGSYQSAATISGTSLTASGGSIDMYVAKYVDNGTTVSSGGALSGGGGSSDAGFAIAVNGNNVYVAGYMSANATTPVIAGTTLTSAGGQDMFVARFTDSGTLGNGSAVSGGGGGLDRALAIGVNANGVYVTGYLSANAIAPTIQGAAAANAGGQDMFLAKYTSNLGNAGVVSSGGSGNDQGQALTISGNTIYVAGTFNGTASIAGSSLTSAGVADMFVAKYTDSGSGLTSGFAARDGGADTEAVGDIAVSGSTVYVVGSYNNGTTLSGSSLTSTGTDAFVAKYTDLGGSLANQGAIDGGSNVAGTSSALTISLSGPQALVAGAVTTPATFGSVAVASGTAFVARLAPASTTLTSIALGGSSPTNATSVTYTVTFASSITGLSASNFSLTSTGTVAGASITSVAGSGTTYTVTVSTGTGDGTLRLNLANDTGLSLAISNSPYNSGPAYTIDKTAPTVVITSGTAANNGTSSSATFAYTVTFSEAVTGFVAGDVTVTNGTLSGFAGSGTTYTFNVTPTANGAVTVNVPANVAQDAATNGNTAATPSPYTITYAAPNTTVVSITRLMPSPTATTQVSYRVTFAASISGITVSNFSVTNTGSVSGASVSSVSGSGTTYTVTVNTGTGDGSVRLNLANSTGITPTVTNVPYTAGEVYTITKSFPAAPQLTIVGTGGTGSDVTAFVDVAQVLSGGSAFANGLQNGSFETHNPLANGDFGYAPTGATWTFNAQAGIAESGSAFTPTTPIPNGIAVAFVQSNGGGNGQLQQNLAVPTGSNYQVSFQAAQRVCCTTLDQSLNVFLNGVFLGTIQPGSSSYSTFTSPTFSVTAPALTATVSTTSASPTSTAPIPFSVTFSQSVGTTFTASDVTVTGGTLNTPSFTGSGSGPYTFTVTPTGAGTVAVSLAANVALDGNNTGNTASNTVSVQFSPLTAATVTTATQTGVTSNRAVLGGNVTADGGATVTDRGVVYSTTNTTPTTADTKDANGTGTGTFSKTVTGLTPGTTYYVRAYAINSVGTSYGTVINFTTLAPVSGTTVVTNVSCFGGSNGTINLTPSGGVAPYTFLWNNGATTEDRTGLTAGTYSVTITDAAGATGTVNNIVVGQPPVLAFTPASQTNVSCFGGSNGAAAINTPTGGTPGYTYDWAPGTPTGDGTRAVTGLTAGTWTVTVTDANGCTATYSFNITSPPALAVTAASQTNVSCFGGSNGGASINVPTGGTPGYTYDWTPGNPTGDGTTSVTGLTAGTWTVTVTDANGCTAARSFTITAPPALAVTAASQTNIACNGGNTGAAAINTPTGGTPGYTYNWTPGNPTGDGTTSVTGLTAGTWTVTVTDANGCTAARSFNITAPPALTATTSQTNVSTNGGTDGSATINVGGGTPSYTYSWSPNVSTTATASNLSAGTYTVTATDANGCTISRSFTITQPSAPTIVVAPTTLPAGTVAAAYSQTITASGGTASYTFAITTGALPAGLTLTSAGVLSGTPTAGGSFNFTVTATDASVAPGPYSGSRAYTLVVSAPTIVVAPTTLPAGTVATAYSQTITASGGTAPYSFAVTTGALPTGLTLTSAGVLSGTPTASGPFNFTVTATDASTGTGPYTGSRAYSVTIGSQPVTAAPVVTQPANGSSVSTTTPPYAGTAPANSTVKVYVDGTNTLTTSADAAGNWTITQLTPLAQGSHTVYATAQSSGSVVSGNSATNTFTVDTVPPTVAISSSTAANNGTSSSASFAYTVTFSENVTGFVASDVTVGNGTLSGFTAVSGTAYTFNVTPAANGAVTVNVAANVAQDGAGNGNTAATQYSITYAQPAMAVAQNVVVQLNANGTATLNASSVNNGSTGSGTLTYTIQKVVYGQVPEGQTLTLSTPTDENFSAIRFASYGTPTGSNGNYTLGGCNASNSTAVVGGILLGNPSGSIGANNGTFGDPCGGTFKSLAVVAAYSANAASLPYTCANVAGPNYVLFTVTDANGATSTMTAQVTVVAPPTATISSVTPNSGLVGTTVTIAGTNLSGATAITVNGTAATIASASASALTFQVPAGATSGNVVVSLPCGQSLSQPFAVITNAPVVTAPANGALLNTRTPAYSGSAPAGSTVTVYVDGTSIGTTTATGGTFTFTQPSNLADGSHTVYATAQASGSAVSANSNTNTFTVDATAPTVAITSTAGASGNTTSTTPLPYTVTFSENVTGFVAGDVTVANGTLSGFTAVSGTTYTFNVTPTTPGTATTVNVPANVAVDQANNGNTASTTYSLTYLPAGVAWNGSASTDWYTAANWTPNTVPTSAIDATIPASAPNMPAISAGTAQVKNLTLNAGSTLTQNGGTLIISADLTNNGTFTAPGGTVSLGTSTLASILGSSNTRFWNLMVQANGAQSSTSARTSVQRLFTLNGTFTTNGNPLTMESNATATALLVNTGSNAIVGNVTVQRYIAPDLNAGLGYRHYSAPVSTATVGSLATGSFTPVVNPVYNTSATPTAETPFPTVYGYDQARLATTTNNLAPFDKGWFSPTTLGDALAVGQGYTVNLAASQTLSVTGPQNNGSVPLTLNLSRNSGATAVDAGWALVGNPFPSPLDYGLVTAADRPNLDAAMYVFESTSQYAGTYRANVNGVGGNANSPNTVLAQGQAFFVRVSNGQTAGSLTLRNTQRITAYQNPVYHRTAETRPLVQLDLTSATGSDPVYVYFENGATTGVDREFDAVKLPNSTGLNVSAETGAQRLAINALPTLGTATVTVPLTVGVPAAGSFSFNAAQLLNLGTTPVYLRDKQTGAVVDLARQPSYSFVVSNASALITGRFELVFSPQAALATAPAALAAQVGVYPNPATTAAFVELPAVLGRVAVAAELVDALGRTVRAQSLPAQGAAAHRLDLANLATGVYTLHLNTSAGVIVKKLVVQ